MSFDPGTRLGPYVIEEFIDAGGMGEVYRAQDPRLERQVAIKVLPAGLAEEEEFRHRFKRETRAISRLNHKNICTVYDMGTYQGRPYIVMELMRGETLEKTLQKAPVELEMVVHIGIQVANALDAAHREGIVHRDIKTANVFLNHRGDAKVLDFGIAKIVQSDLDTDGGKRTRLTGERSPVGTVAYMSPEQARGEEVDARSDLFSLGVVLHEMATGQPPFRGTPTAILTQLVSPDPIPKPRALNPALPLDLERVICRALEKDLRVRYQTAADLLADLRRLRRDLLLTTSTGNTGNRRADSILGDGRRPRFASAFAWVAILAALLFSIVRWGLPLSSNQIDSIAFLPCVGQTLSPEESHFCGTVASRLTSALSEASPELEVKSSALVSPYLHEQKGVFEIGRDLRVDAVASLQLGEEAGSLVAEVEVANVRTGAHIWSRQIPSSDLANTGSLADIASSLADLIHLELSDTDREAWALEQKVLEADYQWKLREASSVVKALGLYNEVILADPTMAEAYSGLAITYILSHYYGTLPPQEAYPRAREAAEKALELDGSLAEAHAALGLVFRDHYRDFPRAELEFTRALELDSQSVSSLQWYAEHLAITGQFDRALEYIRRAERVDPLQVAVRAVHGWILVCAGRDDQAESKLREALSMDPDDPLANWFLGQLQFAEGNFGEAATTLGRAQALSGNQSRFVADHASALARAGQREMALGFLQSLDSEAGPTSNVSRYESAIVHVALGDFDRAFDELEDALGEGTWQVANIGVDPMLGALHDDPRFPQLLLRVGLPDLAQGNG